MTRGMRWWLCASVMLLALTSVRAQEPAKAVWKAGVAKINITPHKRMWMSGYAGRTQPAEGKHQDLWAKALVLEDAKGRRGALVTMDLVGVERDLSVAVCKELESKYGLKRDSILLSVSHTHCGPVVRSNLNVMYNLDDLQRKYVDDYARTLHRKIVAVVGEALQDLTPAKLTWGIGHSSFAVNRRTNKEKEVPKLRDQGLLKGPVDHDVPVLAVRDASDRLRAAVFGYACHATVLSFLQWSGDYPGVAQLELEDAFPGIVALFWAGCGADQNPLPRRTVELADKYGKELADSVAAVLRAPMTPLAADLRASYAEIDLPFAELPTREQLVKDSMAKDRFVANRAKLLLTQLKDKGSLKGTYPYPVQVWQLGPELTWIALGGEVVVDYALRIKKELGPGKTWVMGYANDVMAYIPSLRVLKEGGYEGGGAMVYYGLPTIWSPRVEELIVAAVLERAKRVRDK